MRSQKPTFAAVTTLLAATALICGCKSDPNDVSFDAIRGDITPELVTLSERDVDVQRNVAMTWDQNRRSAWNDLGRVFYWDHPSRLSPYDIVQTSGQPR